MILFIVLVVIAMVMVMFVAGVYNSLVRRRNAYKNAFARIDVQLKRRYDLIPNLVETAKGYIRHERETLEAVVRARNFALAAAETAAGKPGNADAMKALVGAESVLGGALGRLFALSESYPDLKASQTIAQLMEDLSSTEDQVSFARQAYNDAVMTYNNAREIFPNVLIAGPLGFPEAALFEIPPGAAAGREPVKVVF